MNKLFINERSYNVTGTNVSVVGRKLYVNGKLVETISKEEAENTVHIRFEGDLANLNCTSCEIAGNVEGHVDGTNIKCGDVQGNVDGTNITCGNVAGDVDGTQISCQNVQGNVDAVSLTVKNNTGSINM